MMTNFDPDPDLQRVFNDAYATLPKVNWRHWLNITSIQDYEATALHLSGLFRVEKAFDHIIKNGPHTLTSNVSSSEVAQSRDPVVLCHSSGTSGQDLAAIKWFLLSPDLVSQLWAPGMQAIFESSGVTQNSHIAIFVPSRLVGDGLSFEAGKTIIRLYSSEFSQRLVLALLKPSRYLFDVYRNARTLPTIANLLSMKQIDVLSAPATTILGWADPRRLRRSLQNSVKSLSDTTLSEIAAELDISLDIVKGPRSEALSQHIHERLHEVLAPATIIFSTSSMSETDWTLLRTFLDWSPGAEAYTNLYVGSEIGPFAASLRKTASDSSHENMLVFPLSVSALSFDHGYQLLSRCPPGWGRLYTSYFQKETPQWNIDVGDMVHLLHTKGCPVIAGKILRAAFPLKSPPQFSLPMQLPSQYSTFVGGYFDLDTFTLIDPNTLRACFVKHRLMAKTSSMILTRGRQDSWTLFIPQNRQTLDAVAPEALSCLEETVQTTMPHDRPLSIQLLPTNPILTPMSRRRLVRKVQRGKAPKGVLKRWPLYVIQADSYNHS